MPILNLTDAAIQRLSKPESGVKDYWDKTQRGLGIRISASGRRTFNVQVKVLREGRRRDTRIKLGVYPELSLINARKEAGAIKTMAAEDLDPVVVREEGRAARAAR
ncbi:MAG: DUF4102 domain-containing protein, partial [Rhodospirillaceae bacterium]|nr:DUF4102 domain-containing protein [Rhodospirillaceae bacterium]